MKPYIPDPLPLQTLDYGQLITLVGEANAALAEYSGLLQGIINPEVMLSPLTNQEAVLSSKIEGTQATVEEVLEHEAGERFDEVKQADIQEILNYRKALILAQEHIGEGRPISLSLLLQLHQILLESVRGEKKKPGEFRKDQNWIGRTGCSMEQASFVPPDPLLLPEHLDAWSHYLNGKDFDILAQAAVVHAQFELLHPFKDGNGRIGRLLIPLFLFSKGRLSSPMFYLSSFLETNREEYYQRLQHISREGDWNGWIQFFLHGIVVQARDNVLRVKAIMALYERTKARVRELTGSKFTMQLVDTLFDRPIFQASDFAKRSEISKVTLHGLLRQLHTPEGPIVILKEGAGRRPSIYAFPELLNICEGKEVLAK
ncbi:Fic family protein [Sansalvadorimonas verongulae]|uniref:Fic family protein n=1 Tax=Sansalvadorimonas verongulae TaxID=2172824 RepID=UPI0012BC0ED3|nr:Fic/DOC family N-terminal domain-containing protein [Sansalvadorimonas verongulae]MTI14236.1 Fic family protein [Sansalvadorimonas verongulae]